MSEVKRYLVTYMNFPSHNLKRVEVCLYSSDILVPQEMKLPATETTPPLFVYHLSATLKQKYFLCVICIQQRMNKKLIAEVANDIGEALVSKRLVNRRDIEQLF